MLELCTSSSDESYPIEGNYGSLMDVEVSTFTVLLVLTSFLIIIFDIIYRRRYDKYVGKMNGPFPYPIIGNGHYFLGNTEEINQSLFKLVQKYESPIKMWMGQTLLILVDNPEDVQIVLTSSKSLSKHKFYKFFQAIQNGIFAADVDIWKASRRIINEVFTTKYLDSFVPAFNRNNREFLGRISRLVGVGQFDIGEYYMGLTMSIIYETAMGYKTNSIEDPKNCQFTHTIKTLLKADYSRIHKIWQHPNFIYRNLFEDKITKQCRKSIVEITDEIVRKRRQFWKREGEQMDKSDGTKEGEYELNNFLDILIKTSGDRDLITDSYLREEAIVMIVGGAETSAITESFCTLLLAMHPDIQEKCILEVDRVFSKHKDCSNVTVEMLDDLEYLEMTIKETLRRYSVAPVYLREAQKDLQLSNSIVPAGCGIAICAQAMQMNPKYYPDPDKFDPERWRPEEVAKRHKYSFAAFSGGPRGCIGIKFGIRSVKMTMGLMLRHFRFTTTWKMEDIKLKSELLLKSVNGYPVTLNPRYICPCGLNKR